MQYNIYAYTIYNAILICVCVYIHTIYIYLYIHATFLMYCCHSNFIFAKNVAIVGKFKKKKT